MRDPTAASRPLLRRAWWIAALIVVISFAVYGGLSGPRLLRASTNNHFVYLADSYLHGTTRMRVDPPHTNDWASYERITLTSGQELVGIWDPLYPDVFQTLDKQAYTIGADEFPFRRGGIPAACPEPMPAVDARVQGDLRRCSYSFVSFPPGPAVMMLPGVAIWGMAFNDVLFTVIIACLSIGLIFLLLERLRRDHALVRSEADSLWLTLFFGAGTCHLWCGIIGQVWFTAMVVGTFFSLLYLYMAIGLRRPFWAGVAIAGAFAARTPHVFTAVLAGWFLLFPDGRFQLHVDRAFLRKVALFGAAPIVVGSLMLLQNAGRFESASEFGHSYLSHGQNLLISTYGLFHGYFASLNLMAMFAALPKILPEVPYIQVSRHGLALWFSMPAMLWAVWPRSTERMADGDPTWRLRIACYAAVAVIVVTHVFYHNTGWVQFSYRFAMDYLAYVVVLLTLSGHRFGWGFRGAVLLSVAINVFGAVTFDRFGAHYGTWILEALQTAPH